MRVDPTPKSSTMLVLAQLPHHWPHSSHQGAMMTKTQVRAALALYAIATVLAILTDNLRTFLVIGIPMLIVTYFAAGYGLKAYEERQRKAEDTDQSK